MADLVDEAGLLTEQMLDMRVKVIRQSLQAPATAVKACEECGHPIGKKRREIMPAATLCVDCQAQSERRKKYFLRKHDE
ncbi:TraR/DksA C4-type zinc finger protein [Atlantibacter subterraneus]|uniref:TraR/DksA C4-type zinc finger protein n=1 Tax=Atlantibacter subterraneus TaxID=255519 RepID=UPI002FDC9EE6